MITIDIPNSQLIKFIPIDHAAERVVRCANATVARLSETRFLMIYEAHSAIHQALASCLLDEELSVVPGSNAVCSRTMRPSLGILREKLILRSNNDEESHSCWGPLIDFDGFWMGHWGRECPRNAAICEIDGTVLSTGDRPVHVGNTISLPIGKPFGDGHYSMACAYGQSRLITVTLGSGPRIGVVDKSKMRISDVVIDEVLIAQTFARFRDGWLLPFMPIKDDTVIKLAILDDALVSGLIRDAQPISDS